VDIPPEIPLVRLDDVLMEQVFYNLLDNGLKYTPPGTALEIRARVVEGAVAIEVADRGPGLPPGEEDRVFRKFHRIRREGEPGGVGLGLAICRGIVEAHGGTISAANRPGGGSVFVVRLPIEGEPPAIEAEPPDDPPQTRSA
jgi:two-component system sensor histidine kinase KdpD